MKQIMALAVAGVLAAGGMAVAQENAAPVEIELMTYPEIYAAIHEQGKTTVLVVNGGIEQRGPHAVLGRHSHTAQPQGVDNARQLGNALVAPGMTLTIDSRQLNPKYPGSIMIS